MTAIQQLLAPSEAEFQQSIVDLAHLHGWTAVHFRPGLTKGGGHSTAVAYDAAGYVDLTLFRERVIFAEVKTQKGRLSVDQETWQGRLEMADCERYIWRPSDWDQIVAVLTGGPLTQGVKG